MERKEEFYELSKPTGATRTDAWIDVEGGIGTLFAYACKGRRELPNATFLPRRRPRGPVEGRQLRRPAHLRALGRGGRPHQRLQLPLLGHAGEARPDPARRHARDRQAGEPDRLRRRGDGPPHRRIRHSARGCPAADLRRHRRPVRAPHRPGRRHLHRLGHDRPPAARPSQGDRQLRPLHHGGRTRSTSRCSAPTPAPARPSSTCSSRRSRAR